MQKDLFSASGKGHHCHEVSLIINMKKDFVTQIGTNTYARKSQF